MSNELRVLLVEDSRDDAELVARTLCQAGLTLHIHRVDSASGLAEALARDSWDVVISDYNLPGFSGAEALQILRAHSDYIPFIMASGRIGEEEAVALMKSGADDYVMKDRLARLVPAVDRSLREAENRAEKRLAQLALSESEARFKALVSNMPGMIFQLEFGANDSPVFTYVSDGCQGLLGVPSHLLRQDPQTFFGCIMPKDLPSLLSSMHAASQGGKNWDWEGRLRPAGSNEIEWVDLRARVRLQANSRVCWEGIISNITRNRTAELEIWRSRAELARLSAHVENVKEQERGRIAREIHDDLGGTLTAIKIMLTRLKRGLGQDATEAMRGLHSTEALVDTAMEVTRRIATELRPGILDLGIVAAIEWQAAEFERRMEIGCVLTCAHKEIPLDNQISIALFRIFQEALTNIAKHSGATQIEIELESDDNTVTLQVHDNGHGITSGDLEKAQSFGILGMQERARHLGGEADVRRTRNGTAVLLRLPRTSDETARNAAPFRSLAKPTLNSATEQRDAP